jgi:hypothetical protein
MNASSNLSTADIATGATATEAGKQQARTEDRLTEPLLSPDETDRYHAQWTTVQGQFVDQPREAVRNADQLVADLMQLLASQFASTRSALERQWTDDVEAVSTEDLRVAMTRYRSFFERLLAA